jgi:hypothetical protein
MFQNSTYVEHCFTLAAWSSKIKQVLSRIYWRIQSQKYSGRESDTDKNRGVSAGLKLSR